MKSDREPSGPLVGLKILEMGGIGPVPFCGMLLSDLGADVVRLDRPTAFNSSPDFTARGRRSVALDLKSPAAAELCLDLMAGADAVMEGYRPGVMERLGLGPEPAMARNPALVYGRMTGWGQTGPNAHLAGHDINFVAISGALHAIGTADQPILPLNLVGDYGGGALYLAFGLLAALNTVARGGAGQVVDCAMSDGAASLMTLFYSLQASGQWQDRRQRNLLDGGAGFYRPYECKDGKWLALGAIETQFYNEFVMKTGFTVDYDREDPSNWDRLSGALAAMFATRTRDEWCALLETSNACVSPILSLEEAPHHPHNVARNTFVDIGGRLQPAPVPRFHVTPGAIQGPPPLAGEHSVGALADWGIDTERIQRLRQQGVIHTLD